MHTDMHVCVHACMRARNHKYYCSKGDRSRQRRPPSTPPRTPSPWRRRRRPPSWPCPQPPPSRTRSPRTSSTRRRSPPVGGRSKIVSITPNSGHYKLILNTIHHLGSSLRTYASGSESFVVDSLPTQGGISEKSEAPDTQTGQRRYGFCCRIANHHVCASKED